MYTFIISLVILIVGYLLYGKFVSKIFEPDDRQTPAISYRDGIDYEPIPAWRVFLVQLLNIAGLGPIFGAISGALWGPVVYIWIVFGTLFAGAVHDYLSGMLSMRNKGGSISEVVGKYMGNGMQWVMRVFSVVLLVMVGVVFMVGPAGLLQLLTKWSTVPAWTVIILVYYILATFLPIDKIIGKLYPIFGLALILMAVLICVSTFSHNAERPMLEIWDHFHNMNPNKEPIWPLMCITVACGAISGFHATQSPMMARCIKSEKQGRGVFYGAMVTEGVIALIWAAAACAFFYKGGDTFDKAFVGNSSSVYLMSQSLLGKVGMILAMIGVIACPITSGDTAFRSARLTIADAFKIDQKSWWKRLIVTLPLLLVGYGISFMNYNVIWRYFSWSNQTLATIALWAGAVYLCKFNKHKWSFLIAFIPATYMTAVSSAYILQAKEGFKIMPTVSNSIGIAVSVLCVVLFVVKVLKKRIDNGVSIDK